MQDMISKNRSVDGSIRKVSAKRKTDAGRYKTVEQYIVRVRKNEYDDIGNFIKQHSKQKICYSHQDALDAKRDLLAQIEETIKQKTEAALAEIEKQQVDGKRLNDLLDYYEKKYVVPAKFVGKKKVSGMRSSLTEAKSRLQIMRSYFNNPLLRSITYINLEDFRQHLLDTPYKVRRKNLLAKDENWDGEIKIRHSQKFKIYYEDRQRKPATVHRYLSLLQRALSVGVQLRWLEVNPFQLGDVLIDQSIEETRIRVCTFKEEQELLFTCVKPREDLADYIVIAIDTFLRKTEMFSMVLSDIDFENRKITVRELNNKILRTRKVPISSRALAALERFRGDRIGSQWADDKIFPIKDPKKSFGTACRLAKVEDLRWHDLRATGITRMLDAGTPIALAMKMSGHYEYKTFMKYVRPDHDIYEDAAEAMNRHYDQKAAEYARANVALDNNDETLTSIQRANAIM